MPDLGPIVDANVHLWDNALNPVFWLTDRSLVRDLLGDYDALPDAYTLQDYMEETASLDVRGVVWSDAGARGECFTVCQLARFRRGREYRAGSAPPGCA